MRERRKGKFLWVIVAGLCFAFAVLSLQINELMSEQTDIVGDLSEVEYLSSSTQRLGLMVVTDNRDNRVIFYIDQQTNNFLHPDSAEKLAVLDNPEIESIAEDVIDNWNTLYDLFELPEVDPDSEEDPETYDIDSIVLATNNHFNSMTDLADAISIETEQMTAEIEQMQLYSYSILALILFCMVNHVASTSIALKRSNDMAAVASVDIATGLYNRSKCQEIFKDTYANGREQQPAVVVIDLNDLKKTNDIQGHRVGDELISTFASILKEAVNVHPAKPFLGRYGGDEFVVYHKDIENEEQITAFMKELAFLSEEFNKHDGKKFKISYAIGYAINTDGKDGLGTRQLFDEADESMYTNKKKMKKLLEPEKELVDEAKKNKV